MGTIADKLDYLADTKAAIIDRASMLGGITVNDPFRNVADLIYADIVPIGFPNVRKILENDVRPPLPKDNNPGQKHIVFYEVMAGDSDTVTVLLAGLGSEILGFRTSDGATYTYSTNGLGNKTHTYNPAYDYVIAGRRYRWIILYGDSATSATYSQIFGNRAVWVVVGEAYTTLALADVNLSNLLILDKLGVGRLRFSHFPTTTKPFNFSPLQYCCPLDLTDTLNAWNGNFYGMACASPLDIVVSESVNGTATTNGLLRTYGRIHVVTDIVNNSLVYPAGWAYNIHLDSHNRFDMIIDFSKTTKAFQSTSTHNGIVHALLKISPVSNNMTNFTSLDFESWTYLCDNAPTVSAKTMTMGAANQAVCGAANLAKLTAKGWAIA